MSSRIYKISEEDLIKYVYKVITDSPSLLMGFSYCVLCDTRKQVGGMQFIKEWPTCCGVKSNLLPYHDGEPLYSPERHGIYVRSMSRS